jgi:uncharacterized DUF497 family protein
MPVPADRKNRHVRSEPATDAGRKTRDRPQIDQRVAGETRHHDFRWDFARGSEERFLMLGFSDEARLLIVCHCERDQGNIIRIISARKATKNESNYYQGVRP